MTAEKVQNITPPGRVARSAREREERMLDEALQETFPSSDPPALTQPGSGVTGAEVKPSAPSPSQRRRGLSAGVGGTARSDRPIFVQRRDARRS